MFAQSWPGAPTPLRAARALEGRPGLVWLDGDNDLGAQGRYSYVGSDPVDTLRVDGKTEAPLRALDRLTKTDSSAGGDDCPPSLPFRVPHWIGYIAYDATWCPSPKRQRRHPRLDQEEVIWLGRYDALLAHDHITGKSLLVGDNEAACARLVSRLDRPLAQLPNPSIAEAQVTPREEHLRAIEAALEHISAGNIYQVNLARSWRVPFEGSTLRLWVRMREASPVPFGLYLDAGDHVALARTMERFIDWEGPGGRLTSRPIKGTIARHGGR